MKFINLVYASMYDWYFSSQATSPSSFFRPKLNVFRDVADYFHDATYTSVRRYLEIRL